MLWISKNMLETYVTNIIDKLQQKIYAPPTSVSFAHYESVTITWYRAEGTKWYNVLNPDTRGYKI